MSIYSRPVLAKTASRDAREGLPSAIRPLRRRGDRAEARNLADVGPQMAPMPLQRKLTIGASNVARFATDPNADYFNWSLSPDSTRIAIIKTGGNHVYVLPLDGSPVHDLTVGGRSGFNTFSWSVDGKGFFIGSTKANLLFIDLNGEA